MFFDLSGLSENRARIRLTISSVENSDSIPSWCIHMMSCICTQLAPCTAAQRQMQPTAMEASKSSERNENLNHEGTKRATEVGCARPASVSTEAGAARGPAYSAWSLDEQVVEAMKRLAELVELF